MKDSGLNSAADDIAIQVAEYVCGLLRPDEHAQAHLLLSRDDQALALALAWEERLLALVDALPRAQPDPALRERLQRTLGIGPAPVFQPPPQPQLLRRKSVEPATVPESRPAVPPTRATDNGAPTATSGRKTSVRVASSGQPAAAGMQTGAKHAGEPASGRPLRQKAPKPEASSRHPEQDSLPEPPQAAERAQAIQSEVAQKAAGNNRPIPASRIGDSDEKQRRALVRKLWLWRLIGLCAVSAAAVGFMLPGEPPPPPVQIVKVAPTRAAILQAPGSSSTPGWTATLDPQGNLMMRPLVQTEVPAGRQALLWTRSAAIPEPRLLGRIDPNQPIQVPSAQLGALADDQLLEITLERDEDAAEGTPNGPILFIGRMTVFGSELAGAPASTDATATDPAASGSVTQSVGP